jgi:hypothetical protein
MKKENNNMDKMTPINWIAVGIMIFILFMTLFGAGF